MNTFLQDILKATTTALSSMTTTSQENYQSTVTNPKTPIPVETKLLSDPVKLAQMRENYLKTVKN